MKLCVTALLLALCVVGSLAQDRGWRDETGNAIPESESRKSKNGLAGWLLVTSDQDWQARWETPKGQAPNFTEASSVEVGQVVHTLIILGNPALVCDRMANVLCDIKVTRPNGTLSIDAKSVTCLKAKIEVNPDALFLAEPIIAFVGEPKDPRERWIVEVILKDLGRATELPLRTTFVLQ